MEDKIIRPKLEAGNRATTWAPCSIWSSSLIRQTADSITLEVDKVISGATSGLTTQIGQLEVKADSISGQVKTVNDKIAGDNLFPLNGWQDENDKYIEVTDDFQYATTATTIYSPTIHLTVGDYVASSFNTSHIQFQQDSLSSSGATVMEDKLENKYKDIIRSYIVFSVEIEGDYRFTMPANSFYEPKLEKGNTPTPYTNQTVQYSSLIAQTDSSISLKVSEEITNQGLVNETQLKETGIDIKSGVISATSDNFVVQNNDGQTTFTIDKDGNINGSGDATFSGRINAEGGTFTSGIDANKPSLNIDTDNKKIDFSGRDRLVDGEYDSSIASEVIPYFQVEVTDGDELSDGSKTYYSELEMEQDDYQISTGKQVKYKLKLFPKNGLSVEWTDLSGISHSISFGPAGVSLDINTLPTSTTGLVAGQLYRNGNTLCVMT